MTNTFIKWLSNMGDAEFCECEYGVLGYSSKQKFVINRNKQINMLATYIECIAVKTK